MFRLIDTHSHLEQIEDIGQTLAVAGEAGVIAIIGVGSDYESNRKILKIAQEHKGFIHAALGWHPWMIKESDIDRDLGFIEANIDKAVAIGEVGLDYHKKVRERADKDLQKHVLREILKIAGRHDKPVIIHSRYAWRDALDIVVEAQSVRAVFHWYTGPSSVLRDIISQDYYISATPAVEYHEEHRRAIKEAPLERMLLETDSPVVYGYGREFEFESRPVDVLRSLRGAAQLKDLPEAQVAEATTANARKLFSLQGI